MKEKKTRYEMRFAGSGGQGVILCSIILAEAAFLAGKRVAQSQSYGPEARGGLCRAELVVDENEITVVEILDTLHLVDIQVSENLLPYCRSNPIFEVKA